MSKICSDIPSFGAKWASPVVLVKSCRWLLRLCFMFPLFLLCTGSSLTVYGGLGDEVVFVGQEATGTMAVAWGDYDKDGDLDLAVANGWLSARDLPYGESNRIYRNDGDNWTELWTSQGISATTSVAWGDYDNDGDLDLFFGNYGEANHLVANDDGQFRLAWESPDHCWTTDVDWGDWDNDGDLDLAVANGYYGGGLFGGGCGEMFSAGNIQVFANENGTLVRAWESSEAQCANSLDWGDWDNDGDLDLAVGNANYQNFAGCEAHNQVFDNHNSDLSLVWTSVDEKTTRSVAWGDWDNDGDLDLAVGNVAQANQIYENDNQTLTLAWELPDDETGSWPQSFTSSVAWGDWDSDGNLDLAVGNGFSDYHFGVAEVNQIYHNDDGNFVLGWTSNDSKRTENIAWGDYDGDGDLDLIAANAEHQDEDAWNRIYQNKNLTSLPSPLLLGSEIKDEVSQATIAWGDWDNDGDLDLAVHQNFKIFILGNKNGNFSIVWQSANESNVTSLAWGDWDNDGDLDLAVGNNGFNQLYENIGEQLQLAWQSEDQKATTSIAWGDWDNDGDLDLAIGNYDTEANQLYENIGEQLQLAWQSEDQKATTSIAWGDWDNDGDLDLAIGNSNDVTQLFVNENGILVLGWESPAKTSTTSIVWGDWDSDGDLDLAVGNIGLNHIYANNNGTLALAWTSVGDERPTLSIASGDWDHDGDLDLAAGSGRYDPILGGVGQSDLYTNEDGTLTLMSAQEFPEARFTGMIEFVDVNKDGFTDLATTANVSDGNLDENILYYPNPQSRARNGTPRVVVHNPSPYNSNLAYGNPFRFTEPIITVPYTLFDDDSTRVAAIRAFYSPNGGGQWLPAIPTTETKLTDFPVNRDGGQNYRFHWDTAASGFFGQSDNVVFRIDAYDAVGPFQRARTIGYSTPFRVRGTQVRVQNANGPVANAQVYRLRATDAQNATVITNGTARPFVTDVQGYLQGRGELGNGDQLFALLPVTSTETYTLYYTSGAPTETGLRFQEVTSSGVQTLTVSAANPLLVFDLNVALEWDARNDPTFLTQLDNDLRRTSQILYDLTNGQAALGKINVYHDKGFWGEADIVISANNAQRPSAMMGGIVVTATADVDATGTVIPDAYVPGQVRMGATWNRFGNPSGTLGEDWPRVLAHELGHYLFFLSDNYIGVSPDRQSVAIIDCPGSAMTDPYVESYSEFLRRDQWQSAEACRRTLAEEYLGRADWQTIRHFYPALHDSPENRGPSQLPLALTQIEYFAPPAPTTTLADPFFNVVDAAKQTVVIPDGRGQAYLFKTQNNADPTDDYIISLGTPVGELVQARGVAPGDRLCVYDYGIDTLRLGCVDEVGDDPSPIQLHSLPDWQPQVQVSGISTNTVLVTVTNVAADNLAVQLLPALGTASAEVPMIKDGNRFTKAVTARDGAYFGYVRIWVPDSRPHKELIVEYSAIENWDGRVRAWGGSTDPWGGRVRAWGGRAYAWGGRVRAWGAPIISSDGQVSIFPLDNPYAGGARFTLQTMNFPPTLNTWLTPIGRAYRVSSNGELPTSSAILFNYFARNVPDGYEEQATVYFLPDGGQTWQRLPTALDVYRNHASAKLVGEGTYLLAATVEMKPGFTQGWNSFGYVVPESQPVRAALASIAPYYTSVFAYDHTQDPSWLLFDPTVPPPFDTLVNTLTHLQYGGSYDIHVTQPVTLYLGVTSVSGNFAGAATVEARDTIGGAAPATYYGFVTDSDGLNLTPGVRLQARINGNICGETTTQAIGAQVGYVIQVASALSSACGVPGATVELTIGGEIIYRTTWDNTQAHLASLGINRDDALSEQLFLPLIMR